MIASLPSLRVADGIEVGGGAAHARPWKRGVLAKIPFALVFALLWGITYVPAEFDSGRRGIALLGSTFSSPLLTMAGLIVLLAWVDVRWPHPRLRFAFLTAAAVIATFVGGTAELFFLVASGIWPQPSRYPLPVIWWGNFGISLATCMVAAFAIDSRTRASQRADTLADIRRERAIVLRRTVEARLQAAQARVDPQFLFDVLASVERLREASPADGDRLLDDLIAYLRAALPDVEATSTTLVNELALAAAWLDIQRVLRDGRLDVKLDVPDALQASRFPPMTLVPLLEAALASSVSSEAATIVLDARIVDGGLRVCVRTSAPVETQSRRIDELRARLRELYGENARVVIENGAAPVHEIVLELPDDHAERDHR